MKIKEIEIDPTKIICLGRNYLDHIKETSAQVPEEPVLFPKTLNCLIGDDQNIIYPKYLHQNEKYNRVDHEVELAFIISKKCKHVKEEDAYDYILGYTVFNDITARKMQRLDRSKNLPWFRSKSFDTFGAIGPKIVLQKDMEDPHNLDIELKLNGKVKQSSNTKHLLFKIPYIVRFISTFFTLEPGDIIATGTPSGISPISPGDKLEAKIEKIGTLTNYVILEK